VHYTISTVSKYKGRIQLGTVTIKRVQPGLVL